MAVLVPAPWVVRDGVTAAWLYLSPWSKRRDCSSAVLVPAPGWNGMTLDDGTTIGMMLNDSWNTNLYNGKRWEDWRALGAYVGNLPLCQFCMKSATLVPNDYRGRIRKQKQEA